MILTLSALLFALFVIVAAPIVSILVFKLYIPYIDWLCRKFRL